MFVTTEMEWNDALAHCRDRSGELTSIQSWSEKEELQKYLITSNPDTLKWWVGLRRNSTKGDDWRWLENHPLDPNVISWVNNLQKDRPGTICGMVDITSKKLQTAVNRCSTEQSFICEYHSITPRPSTDPFTTLKPEEIFGVANTSASEDTRSTSAPVYVSTTETAKTSDFLKSTATVTSKTTTVVSTSDLNTSTQVASTEVATSSATASTTTELPVTKTLPTSETTHSQESSPITTETTSLVSDTTLSSTAETYDVTTSESRSSDNGDTTSARHTTTAPTTSFSTKRAKTTPATFPSTTSNPTRSTRIRPSTARPTTPSPTQPARSIPDTPRPTMVDWERAYQDFEGCYIPGTGGSLRDTVMAARRVYVEGRTHCPEVQISSILWPSVEAGKTAKVSCARGDGLATFQCGAERVCWKDQPDTTGCASKQLQHLLRTVEVSSLGITVTPPTAEESIELSSQLVQATESEETTMEDVIATSQVITALTQRTETTEIKDKEQVQAIVDNVVQAGSNLVSTNKSAMWEDMSQDDKVRSASTLLVAMETATMSMAEEIKEPTVITQKNENIELELRVVDMQTMEKEDKKELVYDASQSESSFSIPMETLRSVSKGGLAKAVFMTHYSMSDILGGRNKKRTKHPATKPRKHDASVSRDSIHKNDSEVEIDVSDEESEKDEVIEETGPRIASYILSASLGSEGPITKLPKPISFTMRHLEEMESKYIPLCSFWNVSKNTHSGFWSQEGCRVVRTNKSHTTCECDHLTNFAILLDVHGLEVTKVHQSLLRLVTIIGCIISCISLLASWITFQCFASLQGERNSIHKNLALTLLLAEILFVFGIDQAQDQILCSVIAGFLHFFFLAAFTWMFIEGLHIIFMLVQVFDASRSRLPYYYLTGYGVPLVVVGVSCLFYYKGYGTDKFCWLTTERYFIWAFAGPVAIILLVNAFFLTYAMSTVCRHSDYVFSSKEKTTGSGIRAWIQGALALEVLLGMTWTFGYFLINEDSLPLAYVFAVLNSLQGLFIFIFHCLLNKKAQKEYRQMARTVVRRSPSSATTHTHSTLTKRNHNTNHSHDMNHSPSNSHQKLNATNNHSIA